jgi:hypothetical protein
VVDFAGWWSREQPHGYLGDTFAVTLKDRATSGSHHSQPPRRRRRFWPVVAGLFVLAVALAMFAWPQGGDGGSGGLLNAIAKAAERTQREPGGRAAMHATVSSPDRSYTMTGGMVFDTQTGRSRVVLTMPDPNSSGSVKVQAVIDGTVMYIQLGNLGSLPGGAEWMSLDFSSFGLEKDSPLPSNGDAMGELELLEAATGGVRKLGTEDVRGVPTTRYRGTVGVGEQAKHLREEGAEEGFTSYAEENGTPLQIDAWIDTKGLVRRMKYVKTDPAKDGKGPTTMDMRVDFLKFGDVPEIEVPDSSEVFDGTDLAKSEISKEN